MAVALLDEVQLGYCDSNNLTAQVKADWIKRVTKLNPKHLEWYTDKCLGNQGTFKETTESLMQRSNQSGGMSCFHHLSIVHPQL